MAVWGHTGGYGSYNMRDLIRMLFQRLLPGISGVTLLRLIRAQWPAALPIVVITAHWESPEFAIASGSAPRSIPGIVIDHARIIDSTDALLLADLDFTEFEASVDSLALALASHLSALAPYRER